MKRIVIILSLLMVSQAIATAEETSVGQVNYE